MYRQNIASYKLTFASENPESFRRKVNKVYFIHENLGILPLHGKKSNFRNMIW